MIIQKKTDFNGNEYWEGTINGKAVVFDRRTDMYGGTYWQGYLDNDTIITEVRTDWFGEEYLDVRIVSHGSRPLPARQSGSADALPSGGNPVGCLLLLLVSAIAAVMMTGCWHGIMKSEAIEVPIIAVVSSFLGVYFGTRYIGRHPEESAFGGGCLVGWEISGILFFVISILCSVIPTSREMYAPFNFGMVLGIALISVLMGGFPGILTGIACVITRKFGKSR